MSISNNTRSAGPFIGNGVADSFPFTFKVFSVADVVVVRADDATQKSLTLNADYSVELNPNQDAQSGGTVKLSAPLADGYNLVLTSDISEIQPVALTNQGGFYPKVIEAAFDRLTILVQQLRTIANRSLRFPLSDTGVDTELPTKASRAGNLLGFDSNGDPVAVAPAAQSATALQAQLGAPAGASLIAYRAPGANASVRTVRDKLGDTVNVKDYGAVGDGVTDDTAAIQAAINAGRCVHFPYTANGYRISASLLISQNNTSLIGEAGSNFASYLNLASHGFDVFNVTATADFSLRHLGVINYGAKTAGKWAFRFAATAGLNMHDFKVYGCHSGILLGDDTSTTAGSQSRIHSFSILQLGSGSGVGIYKGSSAEILELLDGVIAGPGTGPSGANNAFAGIQLRQGAATVMRNLELIGCGKPVFVNPPAGKSVVHTTVHNVWHDSSSDVGCMLDGTAGQIIDYRISDSWMSSCNIGIRVSGFVRGLKVAGSTLITNVAGALVVDNGADIAGFSLMSSEIAGNGGSGISFGTNVSGFAVRSSVIGSGSHFGANANGISLAAGADNYIIESNDLRGNTGSAVSGHSGKSPSKIVSGNLGFSTYASAPYAASTDADGYIIFNHGLYKTPSDVRFTVFGGGSNQPFSAHVVSIDAVNIKARVFSGVTPISNANISLYWEAAA